MTRRVIIEEGLKLANRPDLFEDGRRWLNLVLERWYKNFDLPFMIKTLTSQSASDGVSAPSDFWKPKIGQIAGGGRPVTFIEVDQYLSLRRSTSSSSGSPRHCYYDQLNGVFKFWPVPASGATWDFSYYHCPVLSESGSADDDTPTWKLSNSLLVDAVKVYAMTYEHDDQLENEMRRLDKELMQALLNSKPNAAGSSRVKLGKSFRRRF